MSDSELSDIERFQRDKDRDLYQKAGIEGPKHAEDDFSDEEVMGLSQSSDSESADYYAQKKNGRDEANGFGSWGTTRENYYGGADGEDHDSGLEDEEEEALRLQKEQAQRFTDGDFYDEDDMDGWKKTSGEFDEEVEELPQQAPSQMTAAQRRSLISESYPEVALLSAELEKCKKIQGELEDAEGALAEIQRTALNSYMGVMYAYFALFSDRLTKGESPQDLKDHPVMEGLLKAGELWRVASVVTDDPVEQQSPDEASDVSESSVEVDLSQSGVRNGGNGSELESLHSVSGSGSEDEDASASTESANEASDSDDEFAIPLPGELPAARKTKKRISDFDEAADSVEQQARAKSKQSLRFYTSQIDRRNAVKEDKFSGDLDLPYRERMFERRQRLLEEARKRGLETRDNLGDNESEPESADGHTGIYATAKELQNEKKQAKESRHKLAVVAAKEGRIQEYLADNPNVDKRAINYQIQKNKGITPKRKKENRNARVKKRVRYEAAKKKLGGVRRAYKQPTSAYAGEQTGIRKNVVHSRKF